MRKPCIRGLPRVGRILGRQARGRRIRNGAPAKSTRKGRQKKNPGGNDTAGAQTEQWANPERLTAARGWAPASSPPRRRPAARAGAPPRRGRVRRALPPHERVRRRLRVPLRRLLGLVRRDQRLVQAPDRRDDPPHVPPAPSSPCVSLA